MFDSMIVPFMRNLLEIGPSKATGHVSSERFHPTEETSNTTGYKHGTKRIRLNQYFGSFFPEQNRSVIPLLIDRQRHSHQNWSGYR